MITSHALAKITMPHLGKIYLRTRLFSLLDKARNKPVVWIHAPAGSGKTTMIVNYFNNREIKHQWYQVDAGDNNIASFYYHMGLLGQRAAPRKKRQLPQLKQEYPGSLPAFNRDFFCKILSRVISPGALVLDNYNDLTADSSLHSLIADGLREIPEGITVIVISRAGPPAPFARLQANQSLALIDCHDLAFSQAETKGLVRLFGLKDVASENTYALQDRFNGWCAGMILQLRQWIDSGCKPSEKPETPATVFDYIDVEIFSRFSVEEQDLLLKSAFLPHISNKTLFAITGSKYGGKFLAEFSRNNCFITLYSQSPPVYQYHELFHEFLLKKCAEVFSEEKRQALQKRAAKLLLAENNYDEAAELFEAATAFEDLAALILKYAPILIEHGRFRQLLGLVDKLPPQQNPWVLYWHATALLAVDLRISRQRYEQALHLFEKTQQRDGMFLSWAGIVDTFVMAWDNFQPLGRWITWMEDKLADNPQFSSPAIEARVVFGMFCSLMYHRPYHHAISDWEKRMDMLLEHIPDDNQRIFMAGHYVLYLGWTGKFRKAGMVMERLRPSATIERIQPINLIAWYQTEAMYHWLIADFDVSNKFIQAGLDLAQKSDIHLLDFILLVQRAYALFDSCSGQEREQHLKKVLAIMDASGSARQSHYYYIAALDAQLRGDPERALLHIKRSLDGLAGTGLPFPCALSCVAIARILGDLGRFDEAWDFINRGDNIAGNIKSAILQFSSGLAKAELAFAEKKETAAIDFLTQAMVLGRTKNYQHIDWWLPDSMLDLCIKSLQHNIEVDYVQKLIRKRHLCPVDSLLYLDNWPWPLRIYTLGRFSVVPDNKPILIDAKGRGKPLELLKVLISLGGREVSETRITEALWPDAEGDIAHSAFTTTLSRLRKLICVDALIVRDGQLSLNDHLCWLDTWEFERRLSEVALMMEDYSEDVEKIQRYMHKVFTLYKGAFLAKQSQMAWALGLREHLRLKLLRVIKSLIIFFGRRGLCRQVIELYEKALELDQLAEEYYRGLMKCHSGQGDRAEALVVYNSCRKLFTYTFKIELSEKTEQLYQTIKTNDKESLTHLCDLCRRIN